MTEALLEAAIAEQLVAVDARVTNGAAYFEESSQVRIAVEVALSLVARLPMGRFVGSLSVSGKPQVLWRFTESEWGDAVLKVYGRARPGEAATQRLWAAHGVPCPAPLVSGEEPASWMVMPWVAARPLAAPRVGAVLDAQVSARLSAVMAVAHDVVIDDEVLRSTVSLPEGVMVHLDTVVAVLCAHGYEPPADWRPRAQAAYESGQPVLLHGDLGPQNLLQHHNSGELVLLDACGYRGAAAFDAARWAVRVARAADVDAVLRAWTRGEPLERDVLQATLGVEALMQAGVREIVRDERRLPATGADAETLALLDLASERLPAI